MEKIASLIYTRLQGKLNFLLYVLVKHYWKAIGLDERQLKNTVCILLLLMSVVHLLYFIYILNTYTMNMIKWPTFNAENKISLMVDELLIRMKNEVLDLIISLSGIFVSILSEKHPWEKKLAITKLALEYYRHRFSFHNHISDELWN